MELTRLRKRLPTITKEENKMLEQIPLKPDSESNSELNCQVTRNYMDIYAPKGTKVRFIETSKEAVQWGNDHDPEGILIRGGIYTIEKTEVHNWHTKVILQEYPEFKFNSSHFDSV